MLRPLLALFLALCACSGPGPAEPLPSAWFESVEPVHIVGPLWDVGTRDLRVFLLTTPAGHVLIGGAMPASAHDIEDHIRVLGFDPKDIRIVLPTHAHVDHAGTLAYFKELSGARLEAMAGDAPLLESGGATDFLFADVPPFHFQPVHVDRILQDGDTVSLGGITLTSRLTAGHTPGNTTWVMNLEEGERSWSVVIAGSGSINPGTRLVRDPSYPGILEDYRRALALLEALQPDIWLAPHASQCSFEAKRERAATEGARAFVDPDGYRAQVAKWKGDLEQTVADQASWPR